MFDLNKPIKRFEYSILTVVLVSLVMIVGINFAGIGYFVDEVLKSQNFFKAVALPLLALIPILLLLIFYFVSTLRRLKTLNLKLVDIWLLFVPVLNFLLILSLCFLQYRSVKEENVLRRVFPSSTTRAGIIAVLLTLSLTILAYYYGIEILRSYGWTLFIFIPFAAGLVSVLIFSYQEVREFSHCIFVAFITGFTTFVFLLGLGIEGVICIVMALPIAVVPIFLGGILGYYIQIGFRSDSNMNMLLPIIFVLTPTSLKVEHLIGFESSTFKTTTSVVIDAPRETVWKNVVTFSKLPEPEYWLFKTGVSYPIEAEIEGRGVGAIRYCKFSTGDFVEPITVWDEPKLLAFDVESVPPPMNELTPYESIHPPHLHGYFVSEKGQFKLIHLENGKTLLEGTTWYKHNMWPERYWKIWASHIIHKIHYRVLKHIKLLSENNINNGEVL